MRVSDAFVLPIEASSVKDISSTRTSHSRTKQTLPREKIPLSAICPPYLSKLPLHFSSSLFPYSPRSGETSVVNRYTLPARSQVEKRTTKCIASPALYLSLGLRRYSGTATIPMKRPTLYNTCHCHPHIRNTLSLPTQSKWLFSLR